MSSKIGKTYKRHYRWYVYRLVDPRSGKPFYVGKGSGNRIDAHEQETLKGVCHPKCLVIKDIWSKNLQIIKEKVAYFWNEQDAYDYEYDLMHEIGFENLTNVVDHAQTAKNGYIRTKPFTATLAMSYVRKMPWLFALWLKDRDNAPKVDDAYHPHWKTAYHAFFNVFWSGLAHKTFDTAANKKENRTELISLLKPFGVDLSFEGGNHGC